MAPAEGSNGVIIALALFQCVTSAKRFVWGWFLVAAMQLCHTTDEAKWIFTCTTVKWYNYTIMGRSPHSCFERSVFFLFFFPAPVGFLDGTWWSASVCRDFITATSCLIHASPQNSSLIFSLERESKSWVDRWSSRLYVSSLSPLSRLKKIQLVKASKATINRGSAHPWYHQWKILHVNIWNILNFGLFMFFIVIHVPLEMCETKRGFTLY